jgi:hypothetical protein
MIVYQINEVKIPVYSEEEIGETQGGSHVKMIYEVQSETVQPDIIDLTLF